MRLDHCPEGRSAALGFLGVKAAEISERTHGEHLKSHADFCERVAIRGAVGAIFAATLEIWLAIENPPYGLPLQQGDRLLLIVAAALDRELAKLLSEGPRTERKHSGKPVGRGDLGCWAERRAARTVSYGRAGAGEVRAGAGARDALAFQGSSASIASTVVAVGSRSNR